MTSLTTAVVAATVHVHWFEASMLNCYGLKALHQYLTIPFLRMKQHSLLAQLRRSTEELQQGDLALASVLRSESDSSGSSYRQVPTPVNAPPYSHTLNPLLICPIGFH